MLAGSAVFCSCATPSQIARSFLGVSVESLRNRTEGRFSVACAGSYHDCFTKTRQMIAGLKADIFVEDEKGRVIGASGFAQVFPDCLDATDVGIFFDTSNPKTTTIAVISRNSRLSRFVSENLASKLGAVDVSKSTGV